MWEWLIENWFYCTFTASNDRCHHHFLFNGCRKEVLREVLYCKHSREHKKDYSMIAYNIGDSENVAFKNVRQGFHKAFFFFSRGLQWHRALWCVVNFKAILWTQCLRGRPGGLFHLSCIFSRMGAIMSNLGLLAGSSFMQIFISLQMWGEMPGGMVGRSPSSAT